MAVMLEMLKFAERNDSTNGSVISDIRSLRKSKLVPEPLTKAEFVRLLEVTNKEQIRNLAISEHFTPHKTDLRKMDV